MFLSVTDQVVILLTSVFGGLLLGLLFDLYRFTGDILRFKRAVVVIGDMIFWVFGLILIFSIVYKSSSGLVRVYQLLGFAAGTALYLKLFSGIIQRILHTLACCAKGFVRFLSKILRGPVALFSNIMWNLCNRIKKKTLQIINFTSRRLKKHIPALRNKRSQ